jgi:hypothetical protein
MSQTIVSINNLFNKNIKRNKPNLSTQELYFFFLLIKKNNTQLTFSKFYLLVIIFLNHLVKPRLDTDLKILLSFLYLNRTTDISSIILIGGLILKGNSNFLFFKGSVDHSKLNNFWKKFKKLKRPTTEKNFNEYFLIEWSKKLNTYVSLGFLKTLGDYCISSVSVKTFTPSVVQTSKPLLVSPKFSSTSINKFLSIDQLNNFEFQFLRKNKVYNKGRYSRCRQNYRTGVYMCMYLSVCSIFGLYYWFYKFTFNFSYLWWFFIAFFGSFFFPKIVKYRLYEPSVLLSKFFEFFKWLFSLVRSVFY